VSVYILSGARTPNGSLLGTLSSVSAPQLGAVAIKGTIARAGVNADSIDEVYMGQVVQAGVGQAPARQASLWAGLSNKIPCTTVNKVCGSGMKTIIMASQSIVAGDNSLVIAGGMENMSMAPHFLPGSRLGTKFGPTELKDSMQWDGLWDVYSDRPMGNCAEECASKYNFTREEQDNYAKSSFSRAQNAQKEGKFKSEIVAVTVKGRKGDMIVEDDEGPGKANFEKMGSLRPAFTQMLPP
jgi:acetyl-CoA C-acetyltransferase